MKQRGTTLTELLVVMAIWSAVMSAVLGFYVYGTKVSKRYDALSQQLREVQQLYDRIVGRITHAVILEVVLGDTPAIRYARPRAETTLQANGMLPNFTAQDEVLAIVPDPVRMEQHGLVSTAGPCYFNRLVVQEEGQVSTLLQLVTGMHVSFEQAGPTVLMQVKIPKRFSQQQKVDLKNLDIADLYKEENWRKVTRAFLLNGWQGANIHR